MIQKTFLLALSIYQVLGSAVEVLPAAPVASAIITARSSQFYSQNHNVLAAPLVAAAPAVPVAAPAVPVAARLEAVAPAAPVAPIATVALPPSSASVSQYTRYAQYIAPAFAQYIAAPAFAQYIAAPAAPLLASPVVAPAQPVAVPQQPVANPTFQAPNPDSETVEIESAKLRALPQARNQDQIRAQEQRIAALPRQAVQQQPAQLRAQPLQGNQQSGAPLRRNQPSAAPGLLSSQQFIQGPYLI